MPDTAVVRSIRPYRSEQQFIASEGWSIGKSSFILVDQKELEAGTVVRCEVLLESGQQLMLVEGVVQGYLAPTEARGGGPKVQIRRVSPSTRALMTRALEAKREQRGPLSLRPESLAMKPAAPAPTEEAAAPKPPRAPRAAAPEAFGEQNFQSPQPKPSWPAPAARLPRAIVESARRALTSRKFRDIETPADRNRLLDQLRQRARRANG
ncbi:MAG TPA: hypothetical protein VGJ84_05610 [Polyangiaceae bacterium]|jgi:hypothetical protein